MVGISDLAQLLGRMTPGLDPEEYGFGLSQGQVVAGAFATVAEEEGLTVVATVAALRAAEVAHQPGWARISLAVHSDLQAVGLTAAIATALTAAGISANVIAGYHHDHVFVQWARRDEAMRILQGLRA
jgi:hypothetical protein